MAYRERPPADQYVAYTIQVWPTPALRFESWSWPEAWRSAYRKVAWSLALTAATQLAAGCTFVRQEIRVATTLGRVTFTISQTGTSVHILVSGFRGPHVPGPGPGDGLGLQPEPIDGLVIGLSGADRRFTVVVFFGVAPPIETVGSSVGSYYDCCGSFNSGSRNFAVVDMANIARTRHLVARNPLNCSPRSASSRTRAVRFGASIPSDGPAFRDAIPPIRFGVPGDGLVGGTENWHRLNKEE